MSSPIERLIDASGMRCTICKAAMGTCDCWEKCSCGWSALKGEVCHNPATRSCSTKVKYGKYNRRTKRWESAGVVSP